MTRKPAIREMLATAIDALGGRSDNAGLRKYILSRYGDVNVSTINAHITLCSVNSTSRVNFPPNSKPRRSNDERYDFLFQVDRGVVERYDPARHGLWEIRKIDGGKLDVGRVSGDVVEEPPIKAHPSVSVVATDRDWFWEGNVQHAVVHHLRTEGWTITFVADTASKEQGIDIEAEKESRELAVEVKGWPSKFYAPGHQRAGELKPTAPATQARHWFSEQLLACVILRSARPDTEIVMAFPDYPTFRRNATRLEVSLRLLKLQVWLVGQDGSVGALL